MTCSINIVAVKFVVINGTILNKNPKAKIHLKLRPVYNQE